jgi:hypothetical protein
VFAKSTSAPNNVQAKSSFQKFAKVVTPRNASAVVAPAQPPAVRKKASVPPFVTPFSRRNSTSAVPPSPVTPSVLLRKPGTHDCHKKNKSINQILVSDSCFCNMDCCRFLLALNSRLCDSIQSMKGLFYFFTFSCLRLVRVSVTRGDAHRACLSLSVETKKRWYSYADLSLFLLFTAADKVGQAGAFASRKSEPPTAANADDPHRDSTDAHPGHLKGPLDAVEA